MKIQGRIRSAVIGSSVWPSRNAKLEIGCNGLFGAGDFAFRVTDSVANRRAYHLGRDITIEVKLGK